MYGANVRMATMDIMKSFQGCESYTAIWERRWPRVGVKIHPGAKVILRALHDSGFEAYLVGGCVRDLLRGTEPHDWDICTSALPKQVKRVFEGQRIIETGFKHGTVTVMERGVQFELTTYRIDGQYSDSRHPDKVRFTASLREDLSRRDFTMNAIAMDLAGRIYDPFDGATDIMARQIRCVGDPDQRFQEDGLRVMRALRFASTLDFAINRQTAEAVHRNQGQLKKVAAERIKAELCKLICGPGAGSVLREFPNVFLEFWPELELLYSLQQHNPWHCWDGWEHTIRAVEAAPAEIVLRLTMLLHDIGKPAVKTTDKDGIDHFYGHPAISAELAEKMLRALKFDNETLHHVVLLIENHDMPIEPKEKIIRRLLHKLGSKEFYQLIEVHRADYTAQSGDKAEERFAALDEAKRLADQIIEKQQCLTLRDLAVSGKDVMLAGIATGPAIGQILNTLLERVINEELPNDREVLFDAIRQMTKDNGRAPS